MRTCQGLDIKNLLLLSATLLQQIQGRPDQGFAAQASTYPHKLLVHPTVSGRDFRLEPGDQPGGNLLGIGAVTNR